MRRTPSKLEEAKNDSTWSWSGDTGVAFRETVDAIAKGMDPVDSYSKDAAAVFRAFAGRLKRGREKFQDYADSAVEGRLILNGDWITMPIPPPQQMSQAGSPPPISSMQGDVCVEPWIPGEFEKARELFKSIAEGVGGWWRDLNDWIDENMVPLINRATDFDELTRVLNTLGEGNDLARGTAMNVIDASWAGRLRYFEDSAAEARKAADAHTQWRNSGDLATREPDFYKTQRDLNAMRDTLDREVGKLRIGSRAIPIIGVAVDVVAAGIDIANGGSISSNAIGIGASAAAGAALGVMATALISAPGGAVVLGVGIDAYFAGQGAVLLYESHVPLDVREAIDAGDWDYVF